MMSDELEPRKPTRPQTPYSPEEIIQVKLDFLNALSVVRYKVKASRTIGVSYATIAKWLEADQEFAEAVAEEELFQAEELSEEIRRRAVDGIDKPVYFQGVLVDTNKAFSDILLIFEAKRRDPQYRDRAPQETSDATKLYENVDTDRI